MKVVKQVLKVANVEALTFTGGEPFLSERFEEVVLFTRLRRKKVNIITNGNSATPDSLKRLVKMGVQLFELPFHSYRADIHDAMTSKNGSWNKTYQSMMSLIQNGAYVVPVIVLTKLNYHVLAETLEFLAKKGFQRIIINRFNIGGNGIRWNNELQLSKKELNTAFEQANEYSEKLGLTISSNVCTPFCIIDPKDYLNLQFGSCPAEARYKPITVDLNGDMRLCNHSPIVVGNIFTTDIYELLDSDYARSWAELKPSFCSDCTKFDDCLGGCRAASEQLQKTLLDIDPIIDFESSTKN